MKSIYYNSKLIITYFQFQNQHLESELDGISEQLKDNTYIKLTTGLRRHSYWLKERLQDNATNIENV